MKRLLVLAALCAFASAGLAQTQPAKTMPAGHPPIEEMMKAMGGMGGGGGMPGGMGPMPAMTQNAPKGTLTIVVKPGSKGGAPVGEKDILVELFHRGVAIKKVPAKLNGDGIAVVSDIPLMPPVQPMVTLEYGGIPQQGVGQTLSASEPEHRVEMKVFETTTEKPLWSVAMRHVIVHWDAEHLHVTEMLSVQSASDRAWLGEIDPKTNKRVTMVLDVPPDATEVKLDGGFDDATEITPGKIVTGGALFPGRSEYRINYTIHAANGKANLPITAPTDVGSMMIFLPADGVNVTATGITGGKEVNMGEGPVRMYRDSNVKAGSTATLAISGLGAEALAAPTTESKLNAKTVALAGVFMIVLGGIAWILARKPKTAEVPADSKKKPTKREASRTA